MALAFYRNGKEIRRYSTLDIAGEERAEAGSFSKFKNVSASVSHYDVFASLPQLTRISDTWVVKATTVDGRSLVFNPETGELQ